MLPTIPETSGMKTGFDVVPVMVNGIPAPCDFPPPVKDEIAELSVPTAPFAAASFAIILQASCPLELTFPLPVIVPIDGTTKLQFSARVPSGPTRTVALRVWISVSAPLPPPNPVNDESAPNFDFRLKPVILAVDRFTGPVITR